MHKGVIVQWFVGRRDFLERHQAGAGVPTKWVWLRRPIQIPGSAGIPFKVVFGVLVIAKDPSEARPGCSETRCASGGSRPCRSRRLVPSPFRYRRPLRRETLGFSDGGIAYALVALLRPRLTGGGPRQQCVSNAVVNCEAMSWAFLVLDLMALHHPPARPVAGHPRPRLLLRLAQAGARRLFAALVHDSKLTVNDPNPEASHRPILYDSGRPSSVIWFRTLHATTDSATRPPRDRARSRSPIIDLYRKNAFSTRAWRW